MKRLTTSILLFLIFLALATTVFLQERYIAEQRETIVDLEAMIMELRHENEQLEIKIDKLKTIPAVVTAYAPFDNQSGICNDGDPSRTSTGQTPSRGIVAVDPARIPYGTKLNIPGYGIVIAGDTGGALVKDKENIRIDVFAETYEEAMAWGVQNLEVIILS